MKSYVIHLNHLFTSLLFPAFIHGRMVRCHKDKELLDLVIGDKPRKITKTLFWFREHCLCNNELYFLQSETQQSVFAAAILGFDL